MRQRFVTFAVLGLVLALLAEWNLRSRAISPLDKLNQFWLEFCVGNSGNKLSDPAITVIRINDDYEPTLKKRVSSGKTEDENQQHSVMLSVIPILKGFMVAITE